ncbi:MAG: hypothetical protein JNM95_06475 [Chitinophagaceae bacterium]|nr:hypothetical protein [Chitinophagaceae bacterium]
MKKVLFLLLCFVYVYSYAQTSYLDSLHHILKTSTVPQKKIDVLNEIAFEYRKGDTDSGLIFARESFRLLKNSTYHYGFGCYYRAMAGLLLNENTDSAMVLLKKAVQEFKIVNNKKAIVSELTNIANVYIAKTEYDSALHYLQQAKQTISNTTSLNDFERSTTIMWIYHALGNIHYYLSNYDSSSFYANQGIALSDKLKNKNAKAGFLINLSTIAMAMKEYQKAIQYLNMALPLAEETNDPSNIILIHTNLADNLLNIHDDSAADVHLDLAKTKSNEIKNYWRLGHIYRSKGDIQFNQRKLDRAIFYYQKGIEACNEYGNDFALCGLYQQIGTAYLNQGNYIASENYFKRSLLINEEDKESRQLAYDGLAEVYDKRQEYKKAYEFKKLSASLKDSIFNQQSEETIHQLSVQFESKQKQMQIDSLRQNSYFSQALISSKNKQRNIAYLATACIFIFSCMSFYLFFKRKKLEKEKALFEERLRFSRDLHDDIGSSLSGIAIYSDAASDKISSGNAHEAIEWINLIRQQSISMVDSISDLIWMVSPDNNTVDKLLQHLHKQMENMLLSKNIQLLTDYKEETKTNVLDTNHRRQILLICKEIIHNTIKYSNATQIQLSFFRDEDGIGISIKDNGIGFKLNEVKRGHGITNIQNRVEELGGVVKVQSTEGLGTNYTLLLKKINV